MGSKASALLQADAAEDTLKVSEWQAEAAKKKGIGDMVGTVLSMALLPTGMSPLMMGLSTAAIKGATNKIAAHQVGKAPSTLFGTPAENLDDSVDTGIWTSAAKSGLMAGIGQKLALDAGEIELGGKSPFMQLFDKRPADIGLQGVSRGAPSFSKNFGSRASSSLVSSSGGIPSFGSRW